jgi:hypothetical protein
MSSTSIRLKGSDLAPCFRVDLQRANRKGDPQERVDHLTIEKKREKILEGRPLRSSKRLPRDLLHSESRESEWSDSHDNAYEG